MRTAKWRQLPVVVRNRIRAILAANTCAILGKPLASLSRIEIRSFNLPAVVAPVESRGNRVIFHIELRPVSSLYVPCILGSAHVDKRILGLLSVKHHVSLKGLALRVEGVVLEYLCLVVRAQNAFRVIQSVLMHLLVANQLAVESRLKLILLHGFNHRLVHVVNCVTCIQIVQLVD